MTSIELSVREKGSSRENRGIGLSVREWFQQREHGYGYQAGSNSNKNWKIGKKQSVVKLFYPKICKRNTFLIFLHKWLANLHGFANICKLPVAQTFKVMQSKIAKRQFFTSTLNFVFISLKKVDFYSVISFADFHFLQTVQKC